MAAYRKLLELAARAAGYDPVRVTDDGVVLLRGVAVRWNPGDDDGDSFRLASALGITVRFADHLNRATASRDDIGSFHAHFGHHDGDKRAAARDAVLRAAAEAGKLKTPAAAEPQAA